MCQKHSFKNCLKGWISKDKKVGDICIRLNKDYWQSFDFIDCSDANDIKIFKLLLFKYIFQEHLSGSCVVTQYTAASSDKIPLIQKPTYPWSMKIEKLKLNIILVNIVYSKQLSSFSVLSCFQSFLYHLSLKFARLLSFIWPKLYQSWLEYNDISIKHVYYELRVYHSK